MPEPDDDFTDDGSRALREARAAIKRLQDKDKERETVIAELQAQAQRAIDLEKQLTFVKAGVPADDPYATYFVKGYDGEMTQEAVAAAWKALRPGASSEPPGSQAHDQLTPDVQRQLRDEIGGADRAAALGSGPDLSASAETAFDAGLRAAQAKGKAEVLRFLATNGRLAGGD